MTSHLYFLVKDYQNHKEVTQQQQKENIANVGCWKQFRNILFEYEIHAFSDHKNLVYEETLSESQRVMRWRPILKEFGPHIHHISGIDNIVADTLSRLKCTNIEHNENEIPNETKLQVL